MPAAENRTPRLTARSSRARSVSPRLYLPRRPKSASPLRNTTPLPPRPKTAPHPSSRPTQFSVKPLAPRKVSETTPMKAVSKPKAGSDKPVAIRPRRPMKLPENDSAEENVEDVRAKHGYFVYVYNDQFCGDPGHADSRPMASVKPMIAIQVLEGDTNDKENSEIKESSSTQDDLDKSDLKPLTLSVLPAGSMDAILP